MVNARPRPRSYIEWALSPENRPKVIASYLEQLTDFERFQTEFVEGEKKFLRSKHVGGTLAGMVRKNIALGKKSLVRVQRWRKEALEIARREGIPLPPQAQLPRQRRRFKEDSK